MKVREQSIRAVRNDRMNNQKIGDGKIAKHRVKRDRETKSHMKQGGDNNAGLSDT